MVTTIGLVNKKISVKNITEKCTKCDGSGMIKIGSTNASRIKGLKVSGMIDIHSECDCENGEVPAVLKIIKRADRINTKPIIIQA